MVTNCITATCFVIDKRKIMFIKHKKLNKWMPPGGHVEPNETPIETVHREVLEETGFGIDIIDTYKQHPYGYIVDEVAEEVTRPMTIMLENVNYKTGLHKHFDLDYIAKLNPSKNKKATEINEIRWVNRSEIDDLDTFENVKKVAHRVFDTYQNL
jgi:8-oxo-dGTP diphosphatase